MSLVLFDILFGIPFTHTRTPTVCDFGTAQQYCKSRNRRPSDDSSHRGTFAYFAPELFVNELPDTYRLRSRADVYAAGVVFVAMVTQNRPFEWDNTWSRGKPFRGPDFQTAVRDQGLRPKLPSCVPEEYRKCTEDSLLKSPKSRPFFRELAKRFRKLHEKLQKDLLIKKKKSQE
jgi:hypothetical protein